MASGATPTVATLDRTRLLTAAAMRLSALQEGSRGPHGCAGIFFIVLWHVCGTACVLVLSPPVGEGHGNSQVADYAERMEPERRKSRLAPTRHAWKIPHFELHQFEQEDEYLQEMSPEDLQGLALKLEGYGQAADPLARRPD